MTPPGNIFFAVFSCTHETAPLKVREQFSLAPDDIPAFSAALKKIAGVREIVVLNTCNRVEIYFVTNDTGAIFQNEFFRIFSAQQKIPEEPVRRHFQCLSGMAGIGHLFNVAAGLDSQMLGESEILGQVKAAYADALLRNDTGAILNRIFQKSFQAASWVRTRTAISRGQISITNIAIDFAQKIFGGIAAQKILIIGAGEVGRKAAQAFISRGSTNITITNRTLENAENLAKETGGGVIPFEKIRENLPENDIIIGAATTTSPLISPEEIRAAAEKKSGGPLLLVDLGVPRNFPEMTPALDGVFLCDLDTLSAIANKNLQTRLTEVSTAKMALASRAERLWRQLKI